MAISTTVSRETYTGDGTTKIFYFHFGVWTTSQIQVYKNTGTTTEEQITSGFTVTLTGMSGTGELATGGYVTFTTAPTSGLKIAIIRSMPFTQEDVYTSGSRFNSHDIEERFDQDCIERQQLKDAVDRAVKVPRTSTATPEEIYTDIKTSAETCVTKASEATSAAALAVSSATSASNSATSASASASSASSDATIASNSASSASTSATSASTSASNAATSEANALYYKSVTQGYMNEAATSASTAASSASSAASSETNAARSESNANTSAVSATQSSTSASTSAATASTKANSASTSATEAANSATAAASSATAAASSESHAESYKNTALGAAQSAYTYLNQIEAKLSSGYIRWTFNSVVGQTAYTVSNPVMPSTSSGHYLVFYGTDLLDESKYTITVDSSSNTILTLSDSPQEVLPITVLYYRSGLGGRLEKHVFVEGTGTIWINPVNGTIFSKTVSSGDSITFRFEPPTEGDAIIYMIVKGGSLGTVAFYGVKWASENSPTLTSNTDIFKFIIASSNDGLYTHYVYGSVVGQNYR